MRVVREGPTRITKATVDAAWRRRARHQRVVVGDASCRGLALMVNSGSMAWTFSYRDGLSVREVAEEVGMTKSAVHRLKKRRDREAKGDGA